MKVRRKNNRLNQFSVLFPVITIVLVGFLTAIFTNYEKNWIYNWNGISQTIKDSVKVSEYRGITSRFGGMGKSIMNEVKRRNWIMDNATETELLKLTKYPNGTVKAIAYEGLLRKPNFNGKLKIVLISIKDTVYPVYYQSGCLGWDRQIGEYIVQDVLMIDDKIPQSYILPDYGFSKQDKEKILFEFKKYYKTDFNK